MPTITTNGIDLYYEEHGSGDAVILGHELAGDMRTWAGLIGHLSRRYRMVAFNYRGFPPTDVPADPDAYTHEAMVDDVGGLMDALGIEAAHFVGHGTGGNLMLSFAVAHPARVRSLVMAGSGAGSTNREPWLKGSAAFADAIEREGTAALRASIEVAPQRLPFARKDPRGWQAFLADIDSLSAVGIARMIRAAIMQRPSLFDMALHDLAAPLLVVVGDRDAPALEASLHVGATAPHAGTCILPDCGHTLILEEPQLFNALVSDFLARVEAGRWAGWEATR